MAGTTLRVDIVADAKGVGPGVSKAESRFGKLGGKAALAGKMIAGGLAAGGVAAGAFALKAVGAASRTEQAWGALGTVYGKNAGQVKAWAKNAATSVGLAKSEYAELSSLIGSQLQGMGVAQDKSAKKSNQLIKVGADLAATYGGSAKEAVEALSSALKGETDPIERYGISLKASDVSARKAAMGLDGLTGKADKQATATATLALINEAGARSTGAFARESNTLAGQQQRLGAKFENLKSTIGAKLLPVALKATTWANRMGPTVNRLGGNLARNLGPAVRAVGRFISGTLVPAGRQLYSWFVNKIAPGLNRALRPVLNGVRSAFRQVTDSIHKNRSGLATLGRGLRTVAEFIANRVAPVVGKVLGAAFRLIGGQIGRTITVVANLARGIGWLIGKVRDLISWFRNLKPPGWLKDAAGWLNFGSSHAVGRVQLVGESPSFGPRQQLHAAGMGDAGWASLLSGSAAPRAAQVTVDARTFVQIDGALDEVAVGAKLDRILADHRRRMGKR